MIKETNTASMSENDQTKKIKDQNNQPKVINYETFESSSEDEFSHGAFESAC